MNKTNVLLVVFLCCILTLKTNNSVSEVGTTGADFLRLPVGARSSGMGEAQTGLADDVNAGYWNPAGLATIRYHDLSFTHTQWVEDISYEYLSYVYPLYILSGSTIPVYTGNNFGLSLQYLSYGKLQGYDITGGPSFDLQANNVLLSLSYARYLIGGLDYGRVHRLYAGTNFKLVREQLTDVIRNQLLFDFGTLYILPWRVLNGDLRFGLNLQNIGPGVKFVEQYAVTPVTIRFGLGYYNTIWGDPIQIGLDSTYTLTGNTSLNLGFEYWAFSFIALRMGYKISNDATSGLRYGIGLRTNLLQFDFASVPFSDLGTTYRVSLSLRFGQTNKRTFIRWINIDELFNLAMKLYENKEYRKAMDELREILRIDPGNERAVDMLRKCQEQLKYSRVPAVSAIIISTETKTEVKYEQKPVIPTSSESDVSANISKSIEISTMTVVSSTTTVTETEPVDKTEDKRNLKRFYFLRGQSSFNRGNFTEAISFWEKVLEIDQNHELSRKNIIRARELIAKQKNP